MNRSGTHWTEHEMNVARSMYADDATYDDIGAQIGRSGLAVYDMLRKRFGATRAPEYYEADPIGLTMECERYRRDAKLGSQILREACMDLFCRTANHHHVHVSDAMAHHLGQHAPPRIPGTERTHKTASVERMAA
jgi:hypothetical protein